MNIMFNSAGLWYMPTYTVHLFTTRVMFVFISGGERTQNFFSDCLSVSLVDQ